MEYLINGTHATLDSGCCLLGGVRVDVCGCKGTLTVCGCNEDFSACACKSAFCGAKLCAPAKAVPKTLTE